MRFSVVIAVMGGLLATATVAKAEQLSALLTGYEESPAVSTTGRGEFTATIDGEVISYISGCEFCKCSQPLVAYEVI
jgi:hypothetical protein